MIENLHSNPTVTNKFMAKNGNATDILATKAPKIRRKNVIVQPGKKIISETRIDIDALLKEAMETMAVKAPVNENVARELSRIILSGEDCFTPGKELFEKKYEERQLIAPNYLALLSGETRPREIAFNYGKTPVYGFSTSGLAKANGMHPENVDGIVLKETPGRYLTAVMLDGGKEGPETAALINAATVYAANDLHLNDEERFPLNFEALGEKTAPIAQEIGLEGTELQGLTARLDLKTYKLEVSGNTGNVHCLVIDPATGTMESYNNLKSHQYRESQLMNADWERIKTKAEAEVSGEKKAKMLARIARIREEGLSDTERKNLLSRIPLPKQVTIEMPVSAGEVVLIVNDRLLQALKAKAHLPGLVQKISEGMAKGQKLQEICRELMATVATKEEEYEIEEASRSLIAFVVP